MTSGGGLDFGGRAEDMSEDFGAEGKDDLSGDFGTGKEVDLIGAGLRSTLDLRGVGVGSGRMELGCVVVFVESGDMLRCEAHVCLLYYSQYTELSRVVY